MIKADPNPVPGGTGPGKTTITWDTGSTTAGEVYVFDGSVEKLFARGPKGSSEAPWISPASKFEFRLYRGTDHKEMLTSVIVSRP